MTSRFAFGENWQSFLATIDEEDVVEEAMDDIRQVFDVDSLDGETFADVGCGSGLFSLAAHRLGADRIVSFDFDEDAIACCEHLRDREENTEDWTVTQGDVLDAEFVNSLGQFDYVYSWGVVHHTGSMWDGIYNATKLVDDDGMLCLGVYNEVGRDEGFYNSHTALKIKRAYNRCPGPVQSLMVVGFGLAHLLPRTVVKRESPFAYLDRYSRDNRGMDYWHDVRDWLGGYPFEFASPEEVETYVSGNHEAFEHVATTIRGQRPGSVNTYVFKHRPSAKCKRSPP